MSLKNLALSDAYRSDRNNLVADFYAPCLAEAESYDRAVGYFTSHSLALAGQGLARLVEREGKIRIIASPHLNEDDTQDIEKGYALREVVEQSLVRELDSGATTQWERDQLGILGRLIADGSWTSNRISSTTEDSVCTTRRSGSFVIPAETGLPSSGHPTRPGARTY